MKIYIAGPYTNGGVGENVRRAVLAGDQLSELGHTPYIPHLTHLWHLMSPHAYEFWLRLDMEWLMVCEAVLRLPGYSLGADGEVAVAEGLGLPVYYGIEEVPHE